MPAAASRSRPGRQHYVPACYLSQFGSPCERRGRLMVFDRKTGEVRPSTPDREAFIRDFYTLERTDRGDAYIAEEALGKIEGIFAPAIARVNETRGLPANIRPLLAFIVMQFLRTPSARAWLARGYNTVWMEAMKEDVRHRDGFLSRARRAHPDTPPEEIEELYDDVCEFLRAPGARIEMDQTTLIRDVFEVAPELEDVLAQRCWLLGMAPDDAAVVTSDDPIILEWSGPGQSPRTWHPGLGERHTTVLVALGPRHILAGVNEEFSGKRRIQLTRDQVAQFNTTVACRAARFVYYSGTSFPFEQNDRVIAGPTDWLRGDEKDPRAGRKRGIFRVKRGGRLRPL